MTTRYRYFTAKSCSNIMLVKQRILSKDVFVITAVMVNIPKRVFHGY